MKNGRVAINGKAKNVRRRNQRERESRPPGHMVADGDTFRFAFDDAEW